MEVFRDPETQRGLRLYIDLATRRVEWLSATTAAQYAKVSAFTPMLAGLTAERLKAQHLENLARLRTAAWGDDWEPYLSTLRARGVSFAKGGVAFRDWTEVFQRSLIEHIDLVFDEVKDDADRRATLKGMVAIFDTVVQVIGTTFNETQLQTITEQRTAILALSSPILLAAERVLVVPLVGALDDEHMAALTTKLLTRIRSERAKAVVLAMAGVPHLDTHAAVALNRIARSARLMGARVLLSGLRDDVTQAVVAVNVDFPDVEAHATLADALKSALATDAKQLSRPGPR